MKVLLFDIDGTLVNAGGSGRRALDAAFESLFGVRRAGDGWSLVGNTDLQNFSGVFRLHFRKEPTPKELDDVCGEYLRLLPGELRRVVEARKYLIMPGVEGFLERLSARRDVLLGLGTGNLEKGAWIKLEPAGFSRYFRFGGFGSDGFERSGILRIAVDRARGFGNGAPIDPGDVYVIGDTPLDVSEARKAGYRAMAVTCGHSKEEEVRNSNPDFIAPDFIEIRRWLEFAGLEQESR